MRIKDDRECEYCCFRQVPVELPPCRGCPCSRDVCNDNSVVAKADAKTPVETFNNYMKE